MINRTTQFGIIRHAPTLWNEAKRIQGQQDSPLSSRGVSMAKKWGKELGAFSWDILLCSDLGRIQQTAEQINRSLHLPVVPDQRLREQDWGDWTGMTLVEVKMQKRKQLRTEEQKGWDFRPPGGESRRTVLARSLAALSDAHAGRRGKRILVVCHEGVIKCLLYHLLGRKFLPEEPGILHDFHLHLLGMETDILTLVQMNALKLTLIKHQGEGK